MNFRKTQLFLQSPNFETLTLNLDSSHPQTLRNLKLSLLSDRRVSLSRFYFTLDGKALSDSTQIPNSRIAPLSTLVLSCRLSGGGGDGGATGAESRDCYLNMYAEKKPDKVDPNEQRLSKWLNCALSNEPLAEPCVIDRLGNVFNKEALVQALLGKKLPKEFGYIKGLKDMINIKLSPILAEGGARSDTRFQCPITGLEFNGKYKFFALRNCGHVLSAKALKEVKSSSCWVCHEEFKDSDRMVINGSDEEVAALRERMEEERTKTRDKKSKKVKNGNAVDVTGEEVDLVLDSSLVSGAKRRIDDNGVVKVSGKVEENGKSENGGVAVKGASNGTAKKRFKAIAPPNANKEVYASIFTSSRKFEFKETYSCRSLPHGRN